MAKTGSPSDQLRTRARVVNRVELRDVPEGTPGRVIMVSGLTWIRYWVRFDNGVSLGSISRHDLATADEWKRHLAGEDVWGAAGTAQAGAGADAATAADGGADGGGVTTPSGTVVPQKLIDRAKAARARLAA